METGQFYSSPAFVMDGVPQGSILGPILFALYMLPICLNFTSFPITINEDDTQLYMSIKHGLKSLSGLLACLNDIKSWMGDHFL